MAHLPRNFTLRRLFVVTAAVGAFLAGVVRNREEVMQARRDIDAVRAQLAIERESSEELLALSGPRRGSGASRLDVVERIVKRWPQPKQGYHND